MLAAAKAGDTAAARQDGHEEAPAPEYHRPHMATLDQLISTLPTDSGQKGKVWERLMPEAGISIGIARSKGAHFGN
jgi:hypothetical protein